MPSQGGMAGRLRRQVGLTEQLDPVAKMGNPNLATGAHCEKALRHGGCAMLAKR